MQHVTFYTFVGTFQLQWRGNGFPRVEVTKLVDKEVLPIKTTQQKCKLSF